MKALEVLIALLGAAVFFVGFIALVAVVDGWALMLLWNWFLVPLGLPPITGVPAAVGIGLVAGLLASSYRPSKDKSISELLTFLFVRPLVILLFGYVVHRFFM